MGTMTSMTRSRRAVLRRREILLGAVLASGCKHAATPEGRPPDYYANPEAYQVSDPVVPPCRFREGDAITVERHGTRYRFVAPSPHGVIQIRTSNPPSAGQGDGELTLTLTDTNGVDVLVETHDDENSCERMTHQVTIPWSVIADGSSISVPIGRTDLRCRVAGPVVTVERALVNGVPTFRIRPTSPRVQVAVAGAAFSDVVEVRSSKAGLSLTVVVQSPRDGAPACNATQEALRIEDADLPALGAGPKAFELLR